jgi:glycosyl transferase, family 25
MIKMKSYLINLDKDTERLKFVSANFDRLGITFERISAIDGRVFSEEDYKIFMQDRPRDYNRENTKKWLRGQMGCFLSHYSVWENISQGSNPFCAVFEDDIHVSDDLGEILNDDSWIPSNIDIIRLETSTNRVRLTARPVLTYMNRKLYGVKSTSWCAGAYIISRKTAQRLVELATKYHEPADVILYHFTESVVAKNFNILQFNPALCTQDKHLAEGANSINFSSNIEFDTAENKNLKNTIGKFALKKIVTALYRSVCGYKRIGF